MHRQRQRPNILKIKDLVTLLEKTPPPTHRNRCARLPLLLAAGCALLQSPCLEVKNGLKTSAGLRQHLERSGVHVRWAAAGASRLASKAKSAGSDGIEGRGEAWRMAYVVN